MKITCTVYYCPFTKGRQLGKSVAPLLENEREKPVFCKSFSNSVQNLFSMGITTRPLRYFLLFFFAIVLLLPACKDDDEAGPSNENLVRNEDASVPVAWMKLYLELDRYAQGFRPAPSPRALAYINLAAYESAMDGMPSYQSLRVFYPGLQIPQAERGRTYHWPTVLNAVYATMLKRMVPGNILDAAQQSSLQFKLLTLEQSFDDTFRARHGNQTYERSKKFGVDVANAFWEWSKTDAAGHEAFYNPRPANYIAPTGPGFWQPTPPDFSAPLFPYWGSARTFVISQTEQLARPPLDYSENPFSLFYLQALETKSNVDNLNLNNQWIAEFWSDDFTGTMLSPPARWISIALQVVENENADLETALYALAKVSIALNDAGVACWFSKYIYNVERPVSYIRRVIDPNWLPHWNTTPSFPAYPSGHATFGAAAAEALSSVFGYNYSFVDRTHAFRTDFIGLPRTFDTFYQAAEENAFSRILLGVHFRMDSEEGLRHGYQIGRRVNEMPFRK